jgi:hypothetical protein
MPQTRRSAPVPFEPGNLAATTHGADSPRIMAAKASVLSESILVECHWLASPVFRDAIERWARATARAELLTAYILEVAEQHPEKIGPRLWESASSADNAAGKAAADLGLTPLSQARLRSIIASTEATSAGLDALRAKGRAIRERRAAGLTGLEEYRCLVTDDPVRFDDLGVKDKTVFVNHARATLGAVVVGTPPAREWGCGSCGNVFALTDLLVLVERQEPQCRICGKSGWQSVGPNSI